MVPLSWYVALGAGLFVIGAAGVLLRRNVLVVLMSLELMLNSANINFIAFSRFLGDLGGQVFAIFVITVTACEVAVALAILVTVLRNKATLEVDEIAIMKG
ncbi:MAG: NADH-quinone oxidoreductase subunit NuoK [Alphaproteobacteria bacterium]|nr:NADH-quinone oxidoreductase subunit NuoK [Alphaproteobacteria bacterium]